LSLFADIFFLNTCSSLNRKYDADKLPTVFKSQYCLCVIHIYIFILSSVSTKLSNNQISPTEKSSR